MANEAGARKEAGSPDQRQLVRDQISKHLGDDVMQNIDEMKAVFGDVKITHLKTPEIEVGKDLYQRGFSDYVTGRLK